MVKLNPSFDVTLYDDNGETIEQINHVSHEHVLDRAQELLAKAKQGEQVSITTFMDQDVWAAGEYFENDENEQWISAYLVTREYGGPEEGGWWYDAGQLLETVQYKDEQDYANLEADLRSRYADQDCGKPLYSVNNTGSLQIRREGKKGADFPERRPHYE